MFLVPLDDRREWYRFHHLFRDLLRFRLRAEEPGIEAELLTEAAHWHLERGDFAPAVEYLLQARQWDEALDLIMSRGSEIFEQGQMATVIRWATEVPDTVRAERREVTLLLGFLKVAEGQAAGGEDLLASVVADPGATPGEQACAQALLCSLAQFRSNPEVTVEMAHTAMDMIGRLDGGPVPAVMNLGDPRVLETVSLGSCGRGHFLAGRMEEAREWLERSLESAGAAYSRRGPAGWSGPRPWPRRPWGWRARRASSSTRSRPMPSWPRPWWPWNAASRDMRRWPSARGACGLRPTGGSR